MYAGKHLCTPFKNIFHSCQPMSREAVTIVTFLGLSCAAVHSPRCLYSTNAVPIWYTHGRLMRVPWNTWLTRVLTVGQSSS